MGHGIERRTIILCADDYEDFLERLAKGLERCPGQVLGWALMPNHFHLLVRAGGKGISSLMPRVMTKYEVSFRDGEMFA
jgi:putative transposase